MVHLVEVFRDEKLLQFKPTCENSFKTKISADIEDSYVIQLEPLHNQI